MRLRFGEFLLDADARQLLRGTEEVRLGPRSFALLGLLVSVRPRALRWEDLLVPLPEGENVLGRTNRCAPETASTATEPGP